MTVLNAIRSYRYFLASGIGRSNARRLVWARLTGQAAPLLLDSPRGEIAVRPNTTDLLMARDVLWREDYRFSFRREPQVIVDAGANIGSASIYFASRFPAAKIVAIEPEPANYQLLERNTSHLNVECLERALWPVQQTLRLDFSEQAECAVRTVSAGPAGHGPVLHEVATVTPQELVKRCKHIDILKLDIEGAESALFSSNNDLSWLSHVDVIIIELHDRFERGCSRNFWASVSDFSEEAVVGENICVARPGWLVSGS